MGQAATVCGQLITCDPNYDCMADNDHDLGFGGRSRPGFEELTSPAGQDTGPKMALRIAYAPVEGSMGSVVSTFAEGDEVAVVQLQKIKGWEPLNWRQERFAKQAASVEQRAGQAPLPDLPRFREAQRAWGAKVVAAAPNGGFEEHWCLLQVAAQATHRTIASAKTAVDDANEAASYAHRFNYYVANTCGDGDPESVPHIKVCAPVAAHVLGSSVPDLVQAGEALTLTIFPSQVVRKFLFEGGEDFEELPHAFFHYVTWNSGGRDMICDIQGVQDDRNFYIVDPVLVREENPTIGDLLGTLAPKLDEKTQSKGLPATRFDHWHPKCGQLCRTFDPQRRSIHSRRHCGLSLPSCGVGIGGA